MAGEGNRVGLRELIHHLTARPEELDEERLREFCAAHPETTPIGNVRPRDVVTVVGEVKSVRIVPKGDTTWLEVTVSDGDQRLVALWTGRRRIRGVEPGRRLILHGRASDTGPGARMVLMNPRYELL